ncbi:MAG: hypothetical protein GX620_01980 [Chloroflexi bacterium]|nr:hypothetical protein [Chloroflexota bacterium]
MTRLSSVWPILKHYDQNHLARIAMPLGGIGTGTVSLGGRGDLRDWELMNRPGKGFIPGLAAHDAQGARPNPPFFALTAQAAGGETFCRALEGPLELADYEGDWGSPAANHGLPRFHECSFAVAYPLAQVLLSDPAAPVDVRLEAFNPLIPGDADSSGVPIAVLRYVISNKTADPMTVAVCGSLPNFIGTDGSARGQRDWIGRYPLTGACRNRNEFRRLDSVCGVMMTTDGVDSHAPQWGTLALVTTARHDVTARTAWAKLPWGSSLQDFWDDFTGDGQLEERPYEEEDMPMASLAVRTELPAHGETAITFLLTWHFPNRVTWTPRQTGECGCCSTDDRIGNYYTTQYDDAWDVACRTAPQLDSLEAATVRFVDAFCGSDLPDVVKEAALFNVSTLRSQTCFRTPDGRFFGWEGACNHEGCCYGSCTHVWNYEQTTAYLFGELSRSMREIEFSHATDNQGLMSFRVNLPLERAGDFGRAAADGQMGCIMKMYRDWQLSGDNALLRSLWPKVRAALAFCWIEGGWDADQDGVMEGCQHNTMDVEYYGPNPQMGLWYLGALRAGEEMARYLGETDFAQKCRALFEHGSAWIDTHLFNGEYYEHEIRPPQDPGDVAEALLVGMGAEDPTRPEFQLGPGCLVDQLVGQYMAHVCGLGYLAKPEYVRKTLESILKYNLREGLFDHFNCMRSFALGDESALLMASYPQGRPENPFPYYTEVMTGFEYTAAIGALYEGMRDDGLRCIANIRERYDGQKRSPFNEAECGHHYARAMAAWAAVLALEGFHYSGVTGAMEFAPHDGAFFWATGDAWGTCAMRIDEAGADVQLEVLHGTLTLETFTLTEVGASTFDAPRQIVTGEPVHFHVVAH